MRSVALLLACFALAAGCASPESKPSVPEATACDATKDPHHANPDYSKETLRAEATGSGAVAFDLPVPASSDGTTLAEWAAAARLAGQGTLSPTATARGPALHVEGTLPLTLSACVLGERGGGNGCCAEQYLHAKWSIGEERSQAIDVQVQQGEAHLKVAYAAASAYCGRAAAYEGTLGAGWGELPGSDAAWCE